MKWRSHAATSELLMLRLAAPRWSSSLERQLRVLEPGGILLAGPHGGPPETLFDLLRNISRSPPAPPILALEADRGGADPLHGLLPPLPSPRALAQNGPCFARQAGELMGEALKLLGFNTYFAVALDLASGLAEKPPGAFSADPHVVTECGASFVEGLSRHKILACAEHFPGLAGAPSADADELPVSGRPMAELWRSDLVPYRELLPRFRLVMMSTTAYKAYDFDCPRSAVLSAQVVGGLLRGKLKYRGVVVAPQLESHAVRGALAEEAAAVQSLMAGCDMFLVQREESWQAMQRGIEDALASGILPRERRQESVDRIRSARLTGGSNKDSFSKAAWDRLVRRYEEFNSIFQA